MRRILCAIDHSETSLRAARLARELAASCKADLTLLNVVRLPDGPQAGIAEYLRHEHNPEEPGIAVLEAAQDELALLRDRLAKDGDVPITCEIRNGEAATEIVAAAREHEADLVVVGHRGRNRLARVLLGSVARQAVEAAHCPVLIVR